MKQTSIVEQMKMRNKLDAMTLEELETTYIQAIAIVENYENMNLDKKREFLKKMGDSAEPLLDFMAKIKNIIEKD